ncbi:hypothetical protein C9J01_10320 [Photobacterium rosenbergii]|uniref:Lipoprotein n=1 Tax=Photobacterium rosenbergii TaxID=294936 RepID=A0A2T3NF98_9GAMM|nr:hypothetical protein [Photobacterium rosenbergii]PSW13239.1 hypothetical protein C9J01_10320 [Photobacterium rosenbergii]
MNKLFFVLATALSGCASYAEIDLDSTVSDDGSVSTAIHFNATAMESFRGHGNEDDIIIQNVAWVNRTYGTCPASYTIDNTKTLGDGSVVVTITCK